MMSVTAIIQGAQAQAWGRGGEWLWLRAAAPQLSSQGVWQRGGKCSSRGGKKCSSGGGKCGSWGGKQEVS